MSLAKSQAKKIFVQPISYCQACSLEVRSVGVTTRQSYDTINKEFVPDYSDAASMLQILPKCTLVDPDSPVASNIVNSSLKDITWWEVKPSGATKIYPVTGTTTGAADGYEVVKSGNSKGEIYVKCNGSVGVQRSLRFKASWYDTQSGYCYVFQGEIGLTIENASEPLPELAVDVPKTLKWNPFRNQNTYEAAAHVYVGKTDMVNDARCKLFWYHINNDGTLKFISSETDVASLEVKSITKNSNGQITALQFDLEQIEDSSYEVRAVFRSDKNFPSAPETSDPKYQFSISRTFPSITAEFQGKTISVHESVETVLLQAIIKDNMDVIPDWNKCACAYWYSIKSWVDQNNTTQSTETLLGTGESIEVSTSLTNFIQLSLEDRGYSKAILDSSGNYLQSDNGEYIVSNDISV